jgi:hypothetical protein
MLEKKGINATEALATVGSHRVAIYLKEASGWHCAEGLHHGFLHFGNAQSQHDPVLFVQPYRISLKPAGAHDGFA